MSRTKNLIEFLSSARGLHYIMPFVIIYLIAGTVAQKYVGLYEATRTYFYAPIIWFGAVPLPGFPVLLGLIFISLLLNLIFKGLWSLRNGGIILTHMAVMLLIGGGFVTGLFAQEGYVDLAEGQSKSTFNDYHARELVLLDENGRNVFSLPFETLNANQPIAIPDYNLRLNIINSCRNCGIKERESFEDEDITYHSMAAHVQIYDKKPAMKDEENMGAAMVKINGAKTAEENGVYVIIEDVPKRPQITIDGKIYSLALQKKKRPLPFSVQLLNFEKRVYPGTKMARAYQSRVRIKEENTIWESVIRMNEPLRYKGYSFYQSSFFETPDGPVSVLAVVKNSGRSFPYIASVIICIGLILHMVVRRRFADRREEKEDIA